jgi:hypothetical protein
MNSSTVSSCDGWTSRPVSLSRTISYVYLSHTKSSFTTPVCWHKVTNSLSNFYNISYVSSKEPQMLSGALKYDHVFLYYNVICYLPKCLKCLRVSNVKRQLLKSLDETSEQHTVHNLAWRIYTSVQYFEVHANNDSHYAQTQDGCKHEINFLSTKLFDKRAIRPNKYRHATVSWAVHRTPYAQHTVVLSVRLWHYFNM